MKIPKSLLERDLLYEDLIRRCLVSKESRENEYARLRSYYLFGVGPGEPPQPGGKIFSHIDLLTAFLFSAESTKFSIHLGPEIPESEHIKIPAATRALNTEWLNSNADLVFLNALNLALVDNTSIIKGIVKGGAMHPFCVEPQCFGVLREDVNYTDRQEAVVHWYYTTKSQLARELHAHPNKDHILKAVVESKIERPTELAGLDRVVILSMNGTQQNQVTGAVEQWANTGSTYTAQVDEDLVTLYELYVWDDDLNDYRVVTRGENRVTIYDRKNFFVEDELPFAQVCPNPLNGYYWGISEVDGLCGLQTWRNERIRQIRDLCDRQVKPPTALTGWMGIADELNFALNRAGGVLRDPEPMGKVQQFAPDMPEDAFREIHEIDQMFAERSGMQNILLGKGEAGVRSGRQTSELARLGSARIKKRALIVEDSLDKLATLYYKAMRVYDKRVYHDENKQPFTLAQMTKDAFVRVDGHSNSPLFSEDQKNMAMELAQAKAIDRASLIEMFDPPNKDTLLRKLKIMEQHEAEAAQRERQAEQAAQQAKLKSVK